MRNISLLVILCHLVISAKSTTAGNIGPTEDSLQIISPVTRIVYQRDNKNKAIIQVKGKCPSNSTIIEARLVARAKGQGISTSWMRIDSQPADGNFSGNIIGEAGWYDLEVCAKKNHSKLATAKLERIGIGEVFIVVGHSVAQGGDINISGSTDDRVNTVPLDEKSDSFQLYLKTGDMKYLPDAHFVKADSGVAPAPFGHSNYFWSKFGEMLAQKENVPVLIYNAAFGGTNLEHWAKAARNIQFDHGFVKSAIRMPYINLYNTLKKYIPFTGVRAILADHGQNDNREKDGDIIFRNYQVFIEQARQDLNYPQLALVVNRQMPSNAPSVRVAQERMENEPFCFPGPDYDKILVKEDRYDGIHLSAPGLEKAARIWVDALTPQFFKKSRPWLPSFK